MNPLCSETYIRLIAQWLPVSTFKRTQQKTRRHNRSIHAYYYAAIDLIGFVEVHRLAHSSLQNRRISVPWSLSGRKLISLCKTRYWIVTSLIFTSYISLNQHLAPFQLVITHLTLRDWWLIPNDICLLEKMCPLLTHLNFVNGSVNGINGYSAAYTPSRLPLVNLSLCETKFHTQTLFWIWPNVVQVNLNGCNGIELYYLAHLPNLEDLSLSNLNVYWIKGETPHIALDWPSLKRVTLSNVELLRDDTKVLSLIEFFPSGGNWESSRSDHHWTKN